jgi:hypothetical protein
MIMLMMLYFPHIYRSLQTPINISRMYPSSILQQWTIYLMRLARANSLAGQDSASSVVIVGA